MLCNDSGMNESDSHILYSMPCENTTCVCVCVCVREVGGAEHVCGTIQRHLV